MQRVKKVGIVISRNISKAEAREINCFLLENNTDVFKTGSFNTYDFFKAEILTLEDNTSKWNEFAIKELISFGEEQVGATKIRDLFQFDTTNIYFLNKFRLYFGSRNHFSKLSSLNKLADQYEKILVYNMNPINDPDLSSNITVVPGRNKDDPNLSLSRLKYFSIASIRGIIGIWQYMKLRKNQILINDNRENYKEILDSNTLSAKVDNPHFAYLYDKLEKFILLDHLFLQKADTKLKYRFLHYIKNYNNRIRLNSEFILISGIFSPKIWLKLRQFHIRLLAVYKDLDKISFRSNFHSYFAKQLISNHWSHIYFLYKYLCYSVMLRKLKTKSVLSIDENSPNNKVIIDAAKHENIKSFAYQHGSIHRLNPAYVFHEKDFMLNPIAMRTFTWGTHWNNILEKQCKYPASSFQKVGQLRTDIIHPINKMGKGIDTLRYPEKYVLYATQPLRNRELQYKISRIIFKAFSAQPDIRLVLRMHPGEYDQEFYTRIADETGFDGYIIDNDSDLYIQLYLSMGLVTYYSTVAIEACYFKKPIFLFGMDQDDPLELTKYNIGMAYNSPEELTTKLNQLISGKLELRDDVYERFISDYAYKIDGLVVDRMISEISTD